MRSDVVKVKRDADGIFMGEEEERSVYDMLSDLLPEIKDNETKSVRISVEIVGEKGEEKVGSQCEIVNEGGRSYMKIYDVAITAMDDLAKDWQPGKSRKVKSILFDTPDGVPVVEFCEETPRERLQKVLEESAKDVGCNNHVLAYRKAVNAISDYLAATEGEGK